MTIYNYTDKDGNILFSKKRYFKKDGSKGYAYNHVVNGETIKTMPKFANGTPLYNLHRLAKYPTAPVYLVEGEKCVDALTKLKLLASTSGGAQSDDKADWQPLAGREVITWADNDDAGLGYIQRATQKLNALNATVKQIDIDQLNLSAKGDCVDWLEQFEDYHKRNAIKADIEDLPLKTDKQNEPERGCLKTANVLLQTDNEVIAWLATLKPMEYDRVRKDQAKALNIQPKTLDIEVKAKRDENKQDALPFADIEPWHQAIDPTQLLDDITQTIQRFIVLDKHQAQMVALWVSACWFVDVIDYAPFALINAPEKACGKTQLLTLMGRLAPRTLQASGISPAALYRTIEKYQPTLFIDEIETLLKDNEPLRGIFNAGYSRDSSIIVRCMGDDLEPKPFNIWGMKAIAGINAIKLADTVTSRSIVFALRRKTAGEKVERLRHAEVGLFENLASKLARFADDYTNEVKQARPVLPDALSDREQDNFEPLLQVASVAGEHWLEIALNAALRLSSATPTPISSANELLADIQEVFEAKQVIKITTTELINTLCEDPEKSWATYSRGKQLTPKQLGNKLKDYGITSKTIRINGYETAKGFEREQFNDAFARYLTDPLNLPSQGNNFLEANNHEALNVTDEKDVTVTIGNNCDVVTDSKTLGNRNVTLEPTPIVGCDVVTDKTPNLGGSANINNQDDVMEF